MDLRAELDFFAEPSLEAMGELDKRYLALGQVRIYRCPWFTLSNRYDLLPQQSFFRFRYWEHADSWMIREKLKDDPQITAQTRVPLFSTLNILTRLPGVVLVRYCDSGCPLAPNFLSKGLPRDQAEIFAAMLAYFVARAQARKYNTRLAFAALSEPIARGMLRVMEEAVNRNAIPFSWAYANGIAAIVDREMSGLNQMEVEERVPELRALDAEPRARSRIFFTDTRTRWRGQPEMRLKLAVRKYLHARDIQVPNELHAENG
jgi:hypothetical protein